MKVSKLIALLEQFPAGTEVLLPRYSDFNTVESVQIKLAVPMDGYVMRCHPTMSAESKGRVKTYAYIE